MTEKTGLAWYGLLGVVLAAVVVVAVYTVSHRGNKVESTPGFATTTTQNTTATSGVPNASNASVGALNSRPDLLLPDLSRLYTPSASLSADGQKQSKQEVAQAIAQLKIDPNHEIYWLQLGLYRKASGDYVGAEDVWLYCVARWPTDPTAYNNLADMYGNYTHQYDKAVVYWNKLTALQPNNISAYINLTTLYKINMHDTVGASATLTQGLRANPNNPDLLVLQADLKK